MKHRHFVVAVFAALALVTTACQRVNAVNVATPYTAVDGARTPIERVINTQDWVPFGEVGGVTLHHPSQRVERIGYHQSNNDGARQITMLATDTQTMTLGSRGRGNQDRTAADIAIDPDEQVRSPATGRVIRAGTYTLYCKHSDDFAVIEPDDHPGWEVKILHIDGVMVSPGDRVVAGQTVIAPKPTALPFQSQIDEFTAEPSWPHVHIEVVDPTIPDRPGTPCP